MARALIIEDHKDSATTLALYLEMLGFETEVVYSGIAGVEAVQKSHPEIVLCDLGLPILTGFEVAERLRSEHGSKCPYLIALSGYDRPEDRIKAKECGFAVHFAKPVDLDLLEKEVSRFLPM